MCTMEFLSSAFDDSYAIISFFLIWIERMVSGEVKFVVSGNFQNKEEPMVNDNDVVEKSEVTYKPDWEINLQDRDLE